MASDEKYLSVLVVISAPVLGEEGNTSPSRPLNVWREWRELVSAIRKKEKSANRAKPVSLTRLNPVTLTGLRDALSGKYDVLHFIGHGNKNGLTFEQESGRESPVSAEKLMETLKGTSLKLIILNACKSEEVAKKLMHTKAVSAVVATGEEISDAEAFVLSERLYSALTAGKNLCEAMDWVREGFRESSEIKDNRADIIKIIGDGKTCFDSRSCENYPEGDDNPIILNEPQCNLRYDLLDNFVGRGWEMHEIYNKFKDCARAVGITGIGGIGKSALASACALKYCFLFTGGIIFTSAKDVEGFGLSNVFSEMDNVLGTKIREQKPENRESYALEVLNSKPHLLILDNIETTKKPVQKEIALFLGKIDSKRSGTIALISSRPVHLEGLSDLVGGNNISLGGLKPEDAVYYLETSCREISDKIEGREEEIAKLCHYHPFMLELTVGALKRKPLKRIMSELENLEGRDLEERVGNWIGTMIADLIKSEKHALEVLEVMTLFVNGAGEDAVLEIGVNSFKGDVKTFSETLDEAVNSGLVTFNHETDRHSMHSLVSSYLNKIYMKDLSKEKIGEMRLNHADYYLKIAGKYKKGKEHEWKDLDADWGNIASAADFLSDKFNENYDSFKKLDITRIKENKIINSAGDYASALYWVVYFRRLGKQGERWLETGRKAFNLKEDKRNEALMCNEIGLIHKAQGNYSLALKWYDKSVEITEKIGDAAGLATTYNNIAAIHYAQGNYPEALKWFDKSVEIMVNSGRLHDAAVIYSNMGLACLENKDVKSALEYFTMSLELYKKLGLEAEAAQVESFINSVEPAGGQ